MKDVLLNLNRIVDDNQLSVALKLEEICKLLNRLRPEFTWAGFYFMNNETQKLHLGPYTGKPTEHDVIPFGKGICGQVAVSGTTYLAEDVGQENNYIACSVDVKSEIVVPVYDAETLVAQLDIDSDTPNAFSPDDREVLEQLCDRIGAQLGPDMHFGVFFDQNDRQG